MKKLLYLIPALFLAACSSPKYTASFQHSNHRSEHRPTSVVVFESEGAVQAISSGEIEASTKVVPSISLVEQQKSMKSTYLRMSPIQRKEVSQLLKKEIKSIVKNQKKEMAVKSAKASGMDHDLKLAAIFGAVGLVGLLLGSASQFFTIIGGIALIIGVVFFVKWIVRQ